MNNKITLLSAVTLTLIGGYSFADDIKEWSKNDLASYNAGTLVTDNGNTYKCKGWPYSGWCSNAAYKPSGTYGEDAWELENDGNTGDNGNTDIEAWSSDKTYAQAGHKVSYNGNIYENKWWTRGENPSQSGQWGVWKLVSEVPQEQATLSIKLPEKPNFISDNSLPDVIIFNNNDVNVAELNNAQWGSTNNLTVPIGNLKISVPAINSSTGSANPTTVSLAANETKSVEVSYQAPAPAEMGSINLSAEAEYIPQHAPAYIIKDSNGNIVKQGMLDFSNGIEINDLHATENGTKYTISVDSYSHDGHNYIADPLTVTVYKHNTTNANLIFETHEALTTTVNVNVSGLPKDKEVKLNIYNDKGSEQIISIKENKNYSVEIPQDNSTWYISSSTISGYKINVTPGSFIADQSNHNIAVKVSERSSSTGWPDRAVVGYVKGYNSKWYSQPDTNTQMISTALDHGYNVFVYAFIGQDTDGTVFFDSPFEVDNMKLEWEDSLIAQLPAQMEAIHNKGGIALIAIGGGVNFFKPDMSGEKAISTGKAMGKFIAEHNFDGLDIDVEHPVDSAQKDDNFLRYIEATRNEYKEITGKDMYLTAAPQISGWYGSGQWASGSAKFAEPMYTQKFMDEAHFDAVFVQTYNQYGGANFAGLKGQDVGFLTKTFELLSPETRDKMPGVPSDAFYVPENTKIVLGVPNFKDPSVTDAEYRVGTCLATAECSGSGLYDPIDITKDITDGGLSNYNQYGGVMTWILNSDDYQGWTWVNGVKGVAYN